MWGFFPTDTYILSKKSSFVLQVFWRGCVPHSSILFTKFSIKLVRQIKGGSREGGRC